MSQNVSSTRVPEFSLGERIRKARKDHGDLSQRDFASVLGVNLKTLNSWENERHSPSYGDLMLISSVADISLSWLAGDRFVDPTAAPQNLVPNPRDEGDVDNGPDVQGTTVRYLELLPA